MHNVLDMQRPFREDLNEPLATESSHSLGNFGNRTTYLKNVTPKTLSGVPRRISGFAPFLQQITEEAELKAALESAVAALAGSGKRAITIST